MTFDEYQVEANKTARYPKGSALEYCVCGLAAEAGEVAGVHARLIRDKTEWAEYRNKMKAEAGDVLWGLAQIATELDFDLSEIAAYNIEKLRSRMERGVLHGSGGER